MITYKSLQNSNLRLKELRQTLHTLPSLRWERNASLRYKRVFEGEIALVKMLQDTKSFLECTYSVTIEHSNSDLGSAVTEMNDAIDVLLSKIHSAQSETKTISTRFIRPVTSSITKIYRLSKFLPTNKRACNDHWIRLGLTSSVAYG